MRMRNSQQKPTEQFLPTPLNGISEALQSDSIDLAAAMNLVSATLRILVDCRSDEECQIIFDNTMEIATRLAIPTSR